jgi:predicted transcriptional regulator
LARKSKFQHTIDVLELIATGKTNPLRLRHATNLPPRTMNKILQALRTHSHINITTRNRITITPLGQNILKYHDRLQQVRAQTISA